jgi:hypothetical protein
LRQRAENLHAGGNVELHYTDYDSRCDDREQKARDALVWLEQKDRGECAGADTNDVQFAFPPRMPSAMYTRSPNGPTPSIEKPENFGSWLISTVSAMPFM